MKFKASVSDLLVALSKAKTTISQKDVQPVLRNFCLKLVGNELTIVATDLDLATVCVIEVAGSEDGVITVHGDKLYNIVAAAGTADLLFESAENHAVILVGKFKALVQCIDAVDYPTVATFNEASPIKMERASFLENLNRISFSISDNEARKNLLAVFIDSGYIQASDGHVSSVCKFDSSINNTLIPALAVPDLVRVLRSSGAGFIEIATTDSFLLFRLDKDLFITRLSQAKFPDIPNKILKPTENNPINLVIDKKSLVAAIKRVSITSNQSSLAVNFKVESNVLFLSSSDIDGNNSGEDFAIEASEDIEFNLNYECVQDICKSVNAESISMKIAPNLRVPIRIEDGDFISLLMRLSPAVSSTKVADAE